MVDIYALCNMLGAGEAGRGSLFSCSVCALILGHQKAAVTAVSKLF